MSPEDYSGPARTWVWQTYGPRALQALHDIGEFAGMAERLVARGRDAYDEDEAIRLASEAVVHRVGEGVARLPDAFITDFPELRLRGFRGMRNLLAHRYQDIDLQILWVTMAVDIPLLRNQIDEILRRR